LFVLTFAAAMRFSAMEPDASTTNSTRQRDLRARRLELHGWRGAGWEESVTGGLLAGQQLGRAGASGGKRARRGVRGGSGSHSSRAQAQPKAFCCFQYHVQYKPNLFTAGRLGRCRSCGRVCPRPPPAAAARAGRVPPLEGWRQPPGAAPCLHIMAVACRYGCCLAQ